MDSAIALRRGAPPPPPSLGRSTVARTWARRQALVRPLIVASVAGTPWLVPELGNNAVPVDVANAAVVLIGGLILWRMRARVRLPLAGIYFVILIASLLAVTQSVVPGSSLLGIAQDLYLYLWALVIVNFILLDARFARLVGVTFAVTGVVIALLCLAAAADWIPSLFGYQTVEFYGRVQLTFRDPNMAGNYLVIALFAFWASPWPKRTTLKIVFTVPFVAAIVLTESNTALVSVAAGTIAAVIIGFIGRREAVLATALAVVSAGLAVLLVLPENVTQQTARAQESIGEISIFQESIGRSDRSIENRLAIWHEAVQLFGSNLLVGIGPASTDEAMLARRTPVYAELHNDYLAGFLERGFVGGIATLALLTVITGWSLRVGSSRTLARAGWRPAAFAGGTIAILLSAITLETLHFRHIWLFLALMIGLGLRTSGEPVLGRARARGRPRSGLVAPKAQVAGTAPPGLGR